MNTHNWGGLRSAMGLAAAVLSLSMRPSVALADPPRWAHARGEHRYVYYPRHQVYFAPETRLWFWLADGDWRIGASLPSRIRVGDGPNVFVTLVGERPYTSHDEVRERYRYWGDDPRRDRHRHHEWWRDSRDRHAYRRGHDHRERHHDR